MIRHNLIYADVAELADAPDLGSSDIQEDIINAELMELADMQDLGSCAERRVGSSPTFRIIYKVFL